MANLTKLTANLPNETVRQLEAISLRENITMTQALANAISLSDLISRHRAVNGKALIEHADGKFSIINPVR